MDVAILGGAGLVGQVFIKMLDAHPTFRVKVVTGSRSAGKIYGRHVEWKIWGDMPEYVRGMEVAPTEYRYLKDVDLIFSALPSEEAKKIESYLVSRGMRVITNASTHRLDPDVPLIVPEVNASHLEAVIERYQDGFIVANPNCSTIILSLFLKPIYDEYGLDEVHVVTMQAVSGAGYPGNPSMEVMGNILPFIPREEEKLERETLKIFGEYKDGVFTNAVFRVKAQANRVPVIYGHTESILLRTSKEVEDLEELKKILLGFHGPPQEMGLHSAPGNPIHVVDGPRPQPRFDAFREKGMAVSVGRLKVYGDGWISAVIHGNNLVRGAAGGTILIAEYLTKALG